jgi:hypothetical protein
MENLFTVDEQSRLLAACGITAGQSFDFIFTKGAPTHLEYWPEGIHVAGPDDGTEFFILHLWMLSSYAKKHGHRGFSCPLSKGELLQSVTVFNELAGDQYADMPVDELIAVTVKKYAEFWAGFVPGMPLVN